MRWFATSYRGIWPNPGSTEDSVTEGKRRDALTEAFLREHDLTVYKWGPKNLRSVLRWHGATRSEVTEVLKGHFSEGYGTPGLFDHGLILGRELAPRLLLGHPYGGGVSSIEEFHAPIISALSGLGLVVDILLPDQSLYGFGTFQVMIRHPDFLVRALRCKDCMGVS